VNTESGDREPKFRRRAEARPDEVLDAALELFLERGFAETRVEEIARRAGLSKGAVYLYFPSKDALLEAMVHRALAPIADNALAMMAMGESGDPRELITRMLQMVARRMTETRTIAIPKLVIREVLGFPQLAQLYRREVIDRVAPFIIALVARGVREGRFRLVDPELTIRSIIGPLLMHLLLAEAFGIVPEGGLQPERLLENHLTILFDGLSVRQEG
jgi:AcrR family transcriptional regulator